MNTETRIADLKTSIALMTGDLRYCRDRAQVQSLMKTISQREAELKNLKEQTFINRCVAALDDAGMGDHNLYIHWFRIDYGCWLDAEEVVNAGGLADYLETLGLAQDDVQELMTRDWDCQDAEGLALSCLGNHGGFDWLKLEELLEAAEGVGAEVLLAGLKAGLEPGEVAENYLGEWESDEDFAQDRWEICGILEAMPKEALGYIDWEMVARDMELEGVFKREGNYYFSNI